MIENIQHDYFIWEEKSSTELKMKLENNGVNEEAVTTNEIKNDLTQKDWRDITDVKLRQKAYNKAYRELNKDKIKIVKKNYYESNKEKINIKNKEWDNNNKEKLKIYKKNYNQTNNEKIKIQNKLYKESHKEELKVKNKNYNVLNKNKRNNYSKNRLKTDIQHKLRTNLRIRLNHAINNNQKVGSAIKDLGCSVNELVSYLESKFSTGMSWDNWTTDGWHIDHIKPLASFDLTDRKQFLEACHYTNLQPMWADKNLSKGKKVEIFEKKV